MLPRFAYKDITLKGKNILLLCIQEREDGFRLKANWRRISLSPKSRSLVLTIILALLALVASWLLDGPDLAALLAFIQSAS